MQRRSVEFDGVTFGYAASNLLFENFSLRWESSLVTAVLGPSGVGKSTLLSLVGGAIVPLSGAVKFNGFARSGERPSIGLVFQSPTLIPWRTVLGNVMFGAELRSTGVLRQATVQAKLLLTKFGLSSYASSFPAALSGGMQQRVSIIRALVSGAGVLLLDEPFSNSDFITTRALQRELSDHINKNDLVAALVTHDIADAILFGDRIVLVGGKPARILDSFEIPISRRERLNAAPKLMPELLPFYDRVGRVWEESLGDTHAT